MEVDNAGDVDNTFRILVATDNHLGCFETDPIRGEDSFITFEEILALASEHNVDFILLGGDLFHDNKPSRYSLYRCIELLRKYTLGNKAVEFQVLQDDQTQSKLGVNYEDPNLNVSYPVFSIHGNHDDPAGHGGLCAMDLLSAMGLVNHFGRCQNMEQVEIRPVLLQKGCTKLALYGLGAVRDERLHRIFRENRVSMVRPKEDAEEWFNVLVFHQNRYKHSMTSYIPESFLDDFLDLVIWGHEHECIITPRRSEVKDFFISQPGSSVATSLSTGEATKKFVGVLEIFKQNFKIHEIELKTVRPFVFDDIVLHDTSLNLTGPKVELRTMKYCETLVEELIEKSAEQLTGHERQPTLPLIRLRVEYEKAEEQFKVIRFGQKFLSKVANPKDIILFHKKKSPDGQRNRDSKGDVIDTIKLNEQDMARFSAVDLVRNYFESTEEKNRLQLLTERGLGLAVQEFVDKEEKEAIGVLVKHQEKKTQEFLSTRDITNDNVEDEIARFKEERQKKRNEEDADVSEAMELARQKRMQNGDNGFSDDNAMDVGSDDDDWGSASTSSGRGGRGTRGGRGRGRGRGAAAAKSTPQSGGSQGRGGRGRGARGSQTKASVNSVSDALEKVRVSAKNPRTLSSRTDPDDAITISDSEEEEQPKSKRSKTNAKAVPPKGIKFYNDDSDDDLF